MTMEVKERMKLDRGGCHQLQTSVIETHCEFEAKSSMRLPQSSTTNSAGVRPLLCAAQQPSAANAAASITVG